jgi:hypothetical protein
MSKIKIIKIEVGEAPSDFYFPYLERIMPKPLKLSFTEGAEINPDLEDTFTREIMPIQRFAYGKHWEEYYMRDEDKEKFEDLVNAYVVESRLELLKEIDEYLFSAKAENVLVFLNVLKKREENRNIQRLKGKDGK